MIDRDDAHEDPQPVRLPEDQLDMLGRETNLKSVRDAYEEVHATSSGPPRWIFLALSILAVAGFFGLRALTDGAGPDDGPRPNGSSPSLVCQFERLVETSALVSVECRAESALRMTVLARRWDGNALEFGWRLTTNRRIPIAPEERTELYLPAGDTSRAQLIVILATPDARDPLSDPELDELVSKIQRLDPNSNDMFGLQVHALRVRNAVPDTITMFPVWIPAQ